MGFGRGYAKTILFGEHFVVYGHPAIGAALSRGVEVEVSRAPRTCVEEGCADLSTIAGFQAIKSALGVSDNFIIRIKSDVPIGSGLGSSAALNVAFARAICGECKIKCTDDSASSLAYEAEKIHHGKPSGIDNTLAAAGGAILFRKTSSGREIRRLKVGKTLHVAIGNTGKKKGSTGDIIAAVKGRIDRNPGVFKQLFSAEDQTIKSAAGAIARGDIRKIGELMDINQGFLYSLGVSSPENESIIQAAHEAGALGAKITGAGCGGACVALAKDKKGAEKIADRIAGLGYLAITSTIGRTGRLR